jgi:multisubunit Na+/H+ antiporter MnhB subunit
MHPVIMATLTRLLLPLALLVSVFILLRGHNLPGGGFIAGLVTAVALIMQYLANGVAWTHARLPANTHPLIGAGLGHRHAHRRWRAGCSAVPSSPRPSAMRVALVGHWIGEFELASAMAFDLGVYLVVVGASLLILINLGPDAPTASTPVRRAREGGVGEPGDGSPDRPGHRPADRLRRVSGTARRTFPVVLGLTLLSYAVNLFLFATGRLVVGQPPVIGSATAALGQHRPAAAGAGAHRHRHRLRHDRLRHHAEPARARRTGQRPCGRPG